MVLQQILKQSFQTQSMALYARLLFVASFAILTLSGCGFMGRPERPVWRTQAENACFSRNLVRLSDVIVPSHEINGPGICGMTRPLKVSALDDGKVAVDKILTIDCPMIPALEAWLRDIVQPDAEARFGQRVAAVNVFGAYSCRPIDNEPGARLSEHAFGNAVDVAGFTLADGRTLQYVRDWKSDGTQEAAFLHEAHAGACQYFTTVLGPGLGYVPLQPYPSRSRQSRRNQHGHQTHLQTGSRAEPPAAANPGWSAACAGDRRTARHRPCRRPPRGRARPGAFPPAPLTGPGSGPDGAIPPPVGETDPAPPVLPVGAGYSVDPSQTSSIADHDD